MGCVYDVYPMYPCTKGLIKQSVCQSVCPVKKFELNIFTGLDRCTQEINVEPAPALEKCMNDLLRSLKRSGAISSQLYSRLYSSAGKTPLLYDLPKVHSHIATWPTKVCTTNRHLALTSHSVFWMSLSVLNSYFMTVDMPHTEI